MAVAPWSAPDLTAWRPLGPFDPSCWQAPGRTCDVWLLRAPSSALSCSYSLSCQLEPRYHWVRKIRLFFKGKKNRSGQSECPDRQWLKPWAQETFRLSVGLRSEEHTSELQSRQYLVCRLLLEKKKNTPSLSHSASPTRLDHT